MREKNRPWELANPEYPETPRPKDVVCLCLTPNVALWKITAPDLVACIDGRGRHTATIPFMLALRLQQSRGLKRAWNAVLVSFVCQATAFPRMASGAKVPSATASTAAHPMGRPSVQDACCEVGVIPFASDNCAYVFQCRDTGRSAVVDPADAGVALSYLEDRGIIPEMLFCTHKHMDHSGGNKAFRSAFPTLEVVAGGYEEIPAVTRMVTDGEVVELGNLEVRALHTPCHTRGHVCFLVTRSNGDGAPVLFSGDTLFVGGCGRFFEGTAVEMIGNLGLRGKLHTLPSETQVYCGHEYTQSNLRFAMSVDPENEDLLAKGQWVDEVRSLGEWTVPTTIGMERQYNPFMRAHVPALRTAVGMDEEADEVDVLAALRRAKDSF